MTSPPSRAPLSGIALFVGLLTMAAAVFAGVWVFRDQTAATAESEPLAQELPPLETAGGPARSAKKKTAAVAKAGADPAFTEDGFEPVDAAGAEIQVVEGAAKSAAVPGLYPAEVAAAASAHVCFFSFNNPYEYQRFKRMLDAIAPHTPMKITVREYVANGQKIARAVQSVIDSGVHCDGVVLSGHHTDEFYGDRSSGDIDTDFFEEMSCNPRYAQWFSNVRALWLAGCKTAQSSLMNKEVKGKYRIGASPLAAFTARMDLSDIEDSLEDIQDILEENIDTDNVVNGYQRSFPAATVFGWSYIAPGEKAGSDRSIPYHIAQLTHILNPDPVIFDANPLSSEIQPRVAEHYAAALYGMLTRPLYNEREPIPGMTEQNILLAWRRQGDFRYKWALDNPDLRAYGSLLNSGNEVLRQLRGVNCLLQALDEDWIPEPQSAGQAASYAMKQPTILPYATYTLAAMLNRHGGQGSIMAQMRETPLLTEYLRHAERAPEYRGEDARKLLVALAPAGETPAAQPPAAPAATSDAAPQTATAEEESIPEPAEPETPPPDHPFRTDRIAPVLGGEPSRGSEASSTE